MTKAQRPPAYQAWFTVSCKFAHWEETHSPWDVLRSVGWGKTQAKRDAPNLRIWNPIGELEPPHDPYLFDHGQALFLVAKGHHTNKGHIPLDDDYSATVVFAIPEECERKKISWAKRLWRRFHP